MRLFFWKKSNKVRTRKLTTIVPEADYIKFKLEARRCGRSLDEWLRDIIWQSMPPPLKEVSSGESARLTLEEAYRHLDTEDSVSGFGEARPAPEKAPVDHKAVRALANRGHPCRHLDLAKPMNRGGTAQGTCRHPLQNGKPCYWNPAVAKDCPVFTARAPDGAFRRLINKLGVK